MNDILNTIENAIDALRQNPKAISDMRADIYTAIVTTRAKFNELGQNGPARTLPNLDEEYRDFMGKAFLKSGPELFVIIREAKEHFDKRLAETVAMVKADADDRFRVNMLHRAEESAAVALREWQSKNGAPLDALCKKLIGEVDIIRRGIDTAKTSADLKRVRDDLATELNSMLKSIVVDMNK